MSSIRQGSILRIFSNCCCAAGNSKNITWLVLNGKTRVLLAVQVVEYVSPEAHDP
jgi:hypothetical protein